MVVLQPIRARNSVIDARQGCEKIGPSFIALGLQDLTSCAQGFPT